MRPFTQDKSFVNNFVLKTPFEGDVARVYLRPDDKVVVQCGGRFKPIMTNGGFIIIRVGGVYMPLPANDEESLRRVLQRVSDALDNWDFLE